MGKLDLVIGGLFNKGSGLLWGTAYTSGRFNINTRYRFNNKWSAGININMGFGKSGNQFLWSGYRGVNKYLPSAIIIPTTSSSFNCTIDPFINYSDSKGNRHKLTARYLISANNNTNNQSNSTSTYYAEYQYQRKIDKINMTFTTGAVGGYNTAPGSPLYGNKKLESSNVGMYLQVDNKFWKRLNTSFGFRLESNKITDSKREVKPVFRAGVNVEAAKYTFIRASFGQGYRFPTIAEKFVSTDLGGFAILPNPGIKSETGMSVELGIKQGIKIGKNFNAFIDVAGFYTQYASMMEFSAIRPTSGIVVPDGVSIAFASQNVGNTRIYGTDMSLMGEGKFFGFPTSLVLGYTFIVPQYRNYDEQYTDDIVNYNVLKYRFRHTFTGQWDIDFKGFGLGTNVQYFSFIENYDLLFDAVGVGLNSYRNTFLKKNADKKKEKNKYKGTAVWDIRASYTFGKTSKYTFAFIVNNVLNKEYTLRPGIIEGNRSFTFRIDMKF
jgi:iron complex outermembrane receptor protein